MYSIELVLTQMKGDVQMVLGLEYFVSEFPSHNYL
jgi:hypothetical protein